MSYSEEDHVKMYLPDTAAYALNQGSMEKIYRGHKIDVMHNK